MSHASRFDPEELVPPELPVYVDDNRVPWQDAWDPYFDFWTFIVTVNTNKVHDPNHDASIQATTEHFQGRFWADHAFGEVTYGYRSGSYLVHRPNEQIPPHDPIFKLLPWHGDERHHRVRDEAPQEPPGLFVKDPATSRRPWVVSAAMQVGPKYHKVHWHMTVKIKTTGHLYAAAHRLKQSILEDDFLNLMWGAGHLRGWACHISGSSPVSAVVYTLREEDTRPTAPRLGGALADVVGETRGISGVLPPGFVLQPRPGTQLGTRAPLSETQAERNEEQAEAAQSAQAILDMLDADTDSDDEGEAPRAVPPRVGVGLGVSVPRLPDLPSVFVRPGLGVGARVKRVPLPGLAGFAAPVPKVPKKSAKKRRPRT